MELEGFVDSEMTETEFADLCESIRDSLNFCICVTKTITDVMLFESKKFSFYVEFPDHEGTKADNNKFVEDNMVYLLEVCLGDWIPVGLKDKFDTSGKKTYGLLKVN
jgi:hypothetical protein